jgi:hypothetical protein
MFTIKPLSEFIAWLDKLSDPRADIKRAKALAALLD